MDRSLNFKVVGALHFQVVGSEQWTVLLLCPFVSAFRNTWVLIEWSGEPSSCHEWDGWYLFWWNEAPPECGHFLDWQPAVLLLGEYLYALHDFFCGKNACVQICTKTTANLKPCISGIGPILYPVFLIPLIKFMVVLHFCPMCHIEYGSFIVPCVGAGRTKHWIGPCITTYTVGLHSRGKEDPCYPSDNTLHGGSR